MGVLATRHGCRSLTWVLALATGAAASACGAAGTAPGTSVERQLALPSGTREIRAEVAPAAERTATVATTEARRRPLGAADKQFRDRFRIAVTTQQVVMVLDLVAAAVTFLGPDGSIVAVLPAEEGLDPLGVTAIGTDFLVWQFQGTVVKLGADGRGVQQVVLPAALFRARGLPDGSFVGLEIQSGIVVGYSSDGVEQVRFVALPRGESAGFLADVEVRPNEDFVVGGDRLYATLAAEYEVGGFSLDGTPQWLLTVPWERLPIPEGVLPRPGGRTKRAGRAMSQNVDSDAAEVEWPTHYPALVAIEADGDGRLWVFPFIPDADTATAFPVDVYAPDGTLLLNATLPFQGWDAMVGDTVYRVEITNGHADLVEYRLELPSQ